MSFLFCCWSFQISVGPVDEDEETGFKNCVMCNSPTESSFFPFSLEVMELLLPR